MGNTWRVAKRLGNRFLTVVKYLLAVSIILGGFSTAASPLQPMDGALGVVYNSRITLVIFGIIFMGCGVMLLYGKIRKKRLWTGRGLMAIYCSYLFGAIIQGIATGWALEHWLGNAILALIAGALWLRWKFMTQYIDVNKFQAEVSELRNDLPPSRAE